MSRLLKGRYYRGEMGRLSAPCLHSKLVHWALSFSVATACFRASSWRYRCRQPSRLMSNFCCHSSSRISFHSLHTILLKKSGMRTYSVRLRQDRPDRLWRYDSRGRSKAASAACIECNNLGDVRRTGDTTPWYGHLKLRPSAFADE